MSLANVKISELNFADLAPREIPNIPIGDRKYLLREASADAATKYQNAILKATKLGPTGRPSQVDGMADTEIYLLSMCLFEVSPQGESPVPQQVIRGWHNRIKVKLVKALKEISEGLEEADTEESLNRRIKELQSRLREVRGEDEDPAKNSPSGSTTSSTEPTP